MREFAQPDDAGGAVIAVGQHLPAGPAFGFAVEVVTFENEVALRMQQRGQSLIGEQFRDEIRVRIAMRVGRIGEDEIELLAVAFAAAAAGGKTSL
jgi:hypothetical protein